MFKLFTVFLFLSVATSFVTACDWYSSIYDCDLQEGDEETVYEVKEKNGFCPFLVSDEYYHTTEVGKVITCLQVIDDWAGTHENGKVCIAEGGLHHRSVDLKMQSSLCKGFSFTIIIHEGTRL